MSATEPKGTEWGHSDNTARRVLVSHVSNTGSISGIFCGPSSTAKSKSWVQGQEQPLRIAPKQAI